MKCIHILGRAAIIDKRHVLLARDIGQNNTFLPGGHVEYNEGVKNAIIRELKEEFNGEIIINGFIGAVEHSFDYKGEPYYEINSIFNTTLNNFAFPDIPKSLENHLDFIWQPINKLAEILINHANNNINSIWSSTIEHKNIK